MQSTKSSATKKRAPAKARKRTINVADVREILGATKTEVARWIEDGRIPIERHEEFYKWGKSLTTTRHDPDKIEKCIPKVEKWRLKDKEKAAKNRKAAAISPSRSLSLIARQAGHEYDSKNRNLILKTRIPIRLVSCDEEAFLEFKHRVPLPESFLPLLDKRKLSEKDKKLVARQIKELGSNKDGKLYRERSLLAFELRALIASFLERMDSDNPTDLEHGIIAGINDNLSSGVIWSRIPRERHAVILLRDAAYNYLVDEGAADLLKYLKLDKYADFFPKARALDRKLIAYLGPTNSGKTHAAMQHLKASSSGCYLAPLRLMALEGFDALNDEGFTCSLVTGEESILRERASFRSSTVEMADLEHEVDVAVIDEAQLLMDGDRGWAWTQAIIGMPAKEVVLTGSLDALPYLEKIASLTGEPLEVHTFERKTPLKALTKPVKLGSLGKGDALIAFSRSEVMRLRMTLQEQGKSVACVYGALGPEVRRAEARRFRNGEADILVATDAIGMGLNLPIRRVIFSTLQKFDGTSERRLTKSEIAQIGGRAGRFGIFEEGEVGLLGSGQGNMDFIASALAQQPQPVKYTPKLHLMPPYEALASYAELVGDISLRRRLHDVNLNALPESEHFFPCELDDALEIAEHADMIGMPPEVGYAYIGCPLDSRTGFDELGDWMLSHSQGLTVPAPRGPRLKGRHDSDGKLFRYEKCVRILGAYLWLSRKWPEVYTDADTARKRRRSYNAAIEQGLTSRSLHRSCRECGTKLPISHGFQICEDCYHSRWY